MLRALSRSLFSHRDALASLSSTGRRAYQKRKMRQVPIWTGDIVEIEYCKEEHYTESYRILKEKLMTEFADLIEVRGNPYGMPRRSAFEVIWRLDLPPLQECVSCCSRRGEDLQEELWSKYASGQPSTPDATYGVAEVVVYDLQQVLKKYGLHRGRYVDKFASTIDEMDYYRGLEAENTTLRESKHPKWNSRHRQTAFKRRPKM